MSTPEISSNSTISVSTAEYFGSPPEPIFNEHQSSLAPELLRDSLKLLFGKNEYSVDKCHSGQESGEQFKDKSVVLFLFELCRRFGVTPDVQYRAAEIFHRFMIGHIKELYSHVITSKNMDSPILWPDVEERLKHQITLRAVSCVQLASKLSSHYHLVTLNRARAFLSQCGFRYAPSSIVQSEVRVLKTIEYKVHNPTPLEFIEALLGTLAVKDNVIPVKQLHGISLKILDVFYLSRQCVYSKFEEMITMGNDCEEAMHILNGIDVNFMLLAAATVTAASFVVYQSVESKGIIVSLAEATSLDTKHILEFAWVLLKEIFQENPDMLENI